MARLLIVAWMSILLPVSLLPAAVIHVPGDQPTIQAGIDAAISEDIVRVADGIYTGEGNRDIDFLGKAITVRSANGPENCIIDCQGSEGDPHRGFFFHDHESRGSVLEGFTIRNGYNSPNANYGGGIAIQSHAKPTIRNNIITENYGGNGGGISLYASAAPLITGNRIENNQAGSGGGVFGGADVSPTISDNLISGNSASYSGGGIRIQSGFPIITGNTITDNDAVDGVGGLICLADPGATIIGNLIAGNRSVDGVGGMAVGGENQLVADNVIVDNVSQGFLGGVSFSTYPVDYGVFINNLVARNRADGACGGAWFSLAWATVKNNTFIENEGQEVGGVMVHGSNYEDRPLEFVNNIVWDNICPKGYEIKLEVSDTWGPPYMEISYSDIMGGIDAIDVCPQRNLTWGDGMLDTDPLLIDGPEGEHYLSQMAAGQPKESPCVDTGSEPAAGISFETPDGVVYLSHLTTRTDQVGDGGMVDMGYHYPGNAGPLLITGPGPAEENPPLVRVFPAAQDAAHTREFAAYGASSYGVNVASGDIDGNPGSEILTGAGPGAIYGPHVRGFTTDGTPIDGLNFLAYGTNKWGVNVAAGDLNGNGIDEIITGAGPGAVFGPHVRAFSFADNSVTALPGVSYFAYGTPKWGANVTAGDIDGDGFDEIVTGAGPGPIYGAHVRGWNVDGGTAAAIPAVSFFAYNTPRYGVNVTCCDVDGDGMDELVTAPGPSSWFGAHIRGWNFDGVALEALDGFSFFAWDPSEASYGARVGSGSDLDGDGRDEFVVCPGPDFEMDSTVKVYSYSEGALSLLFSLQAFPEDWTHGANAVTAVAP
jgi:parallel beta-helix repeat protein